MSEQSPQNHTVERATTAFHTKENPRYLEDSIENAKVAHYQLPGNEQGTLGSLRGFYVDEGGDRVDIMSPLKDPDTVLEVKNGKAERTLAGAFMPGEHVTVRRSSGDIEDGWMVIGSAERNGIAKTTVMKPGVGEKTISTDRLRMYNPSDVLLPDLTAEREARLIAKQHILGGAALEGLIEVPDFVKQGLAAPVTLEPASVAAPEQAPVVETKTEMYARFVREGRAELSDLYAQLRAVNPDTYEADSLTNQINNKKQDISQWDAEYRRLTGR